MTRIPPYSPADYFAQLRDAEQWARERHERLIAAGWEWDGMDGYSTNDPALFAAAEQEQCTKTSQSGSLARCASPSEQSPSASAPGNSAKHGED